MNFSVTTLSPLFSLFLLSFPCVSLFLFFDHFFLSFLMSLLCLILCSIFFFHFMLFVFILHFFFNFSYSLYVFLFFLVYFVSFLIFFSFKPNLSCYYSLCISPFSSFNNYLPFLLCHLFLSFFHLLFLYFCVLYITRPILLPSFTLSFPVLEYSQTCIYIESCFLSYKAHTKKCFSVLPFFFKKEGGPFFQAIFKMAAIFFDFCIIK